MRPSSGVHEPPSGRSDSGKANVASNDKIAEEEPAGDKRIFDVARGLVHDVNVGRVEAKGCCRETVGDQVDPEKLNGNESLGKTKSSCQKDAVVCGDQNNTLKTIGKV